MRHKRFSQYFILSFLIAAVFETGTIVAQTKEEIKQQAESRLGKMTPDQIDAKIKEYGMTRAEAEAKAQQYGIDLESFLTKYPAPTALPAQPPSQTTIIVEQPKTETAVTQAVQADALVAKESAAKNLPAITPEEEQIYGLSFFRRAASSFQPSPSIVDKEYIVGAGDVLKISLWGQLQSTQEVEVDRDGRVTLLTVGPVLVSGYSIEEAKNRIRAALSQSYSGLVSKPPTIFFDLALSKLRPVRVFIMGEVQNPGGYFVNNFANVFNSLFVVGGPKASGTMRDVRVIRNNKTIAKIDLYDYLFGSTRTNDVRVNDNDIIYVPLRGKRVTIRGEVLRSNTFELLPGENLKQLIEFSGGLQSSVYRDRIQIDRIAPFKERVKATEDRRIFDVDFKEIAEGKKDYNLEDGDVVTIFPIIDRRENFVTIAGEVRRPGRYQVDKVKTVKDLINAADGLWPTAYLQRAELIRDFPNRKLEMIVLDLSKVLANDAESNLALQKRDSLRVYSIYEINAPKAVAITGHAKSPGTYPYADSMTFRKVLYSFVGLEDSVFRAATFLDRGDIFRLNDDLVTRRVIQVDLQKTFDGSVEDIPMRPGDEVRIYGLDEITFIQKSVQIFGNVKNPGTYRLFNGMSLTDLILQAGGYTVDAWTVRAEVARITRVPNVGDSLVKIVFPELPDLFDTTRTAIAILSSKAGSFSLIDKDQVFIRPNPDYRLQELVTINGEVEHPGQYAIDIHGERLAHAVKRAGGITPSGYARGARLTRDGVALRLNIEDALKDVTGPSDIVLKPGDVVLVPRKPGTVSIRGEVQNPGIYGYVEKQSFGDYLERAGGETDSSDFAVITFPEGNSKQVGLGWFSRNPTIPDGSDILVTKVPAEPAEPLPKEGQTTYDFVKDTLAIVVSAVTIIVLASKL